MNIVQTIDEFSTNDIILCEPIKNTIMDNSNFIRILISNKDIIINGIYLYFKIKAKNYYDKSVSYSSFDKQKYKKMLFLISNNDNREIIDKLKTIEREILLKTNNISKKKSLKLGNNLDEGIIKVFKETETNIGETNKYISKQLTETLVTKNSQLSKSFTNKSFDSNSGNLIVNHTEQEYKLLLKISGIWENNTTSGITYKFLIV